MTRWKRTLQIGRASGLEETPTRGTGRARESASERSGRMAVTRSTEIKEDEV